MKIRLLGTGGSMGVPAIGCRCSVCRSPDPRNQRTRCSIWVQTDRSSLLIDCSPNFREQALQAHISTLDGVLITHIHMDHAGGMDDLRAFFRPDHSLPVLAYEETGKELESSYEYLFRSRSQGGTPRLKLIPVKGRQGRVVLNEEEISWILFYQTKVPVLGYRIGSFAYVTDMKEVPESFQEWLSGVDLLVLSALQLQPHHSFLSVPEAIALVQQLPVKRVVLTHLSHNIDIPGMSHLLPPNVSFGYDQQAFLV